MNKNFYSYKNSKNNYEHGYNLKLLPEKIHPKNMNINKKILA